MLKNDELIRIFTGNEITVLNLQAQLNDEGIEVVIQNDFQSGIMAGILIASPTTIDLYIQQKDLEAAKPILKTFFD